jgi:PAS domain S-box-containing protein
MAKTTILIVEDEAIVAADLAGKLNQLGYEVVGTAAEGEKAVELACSLEPQVVLMDIWLKGPMDGIEAAEAIRRRHCAPVIFLTAHSDSATLERAKLSDPFGYILKPFEERELATTIEMALYKYKSDRQLRKAHDELELRVEERTLELKAANAYNRSLIEASVDPLVTIGYDGRITDVNSATEAATGRSRTELIGTDFCEYFSAPEKARAGYEKAFAEGSVRDYSLELRHRDGSLTPVLYNASIYCDEQGKVLGVFAAARDITEQKKAQAALQELNDTLEEQVLVRTAQIKSANETLRASRVAALNLMEDAVIARREAEKTALALLESEERVRLKLESILTPEGDIGNLELADIMDLNQFQSLMDDFYALGHIPMALIDLKGKVLVGVGWQDVCTRFYRQHPETLKHCIESDTCLTSGIQEGEYRLYKCINNMWDAATPVMVGGKHLGHLFTGQFFFDDELPDYEAFRAQAARYGFPEADYMAALMAVPRVSRGAIDTAMSYLMKLASMISRLSYSNIKLARILAERESLMQSLRESELFYSQTLESIPGMVFTTRPDGYCDFQSRQWVEFTGVPMSEHLGDGWNRLLHPDDRPRAYDAWRAAVEGRAPYNLEYRVRRSDGLYEWFKVIGRPIRNASGEIVKWFGVAVNIDANKRAEEELDNANTRSKMLADTTAELLASESPQKVVDHLCRRVMEVLDCQAFFNFLVDDKAGRLRLNACAGIPGEEVKKLQWLDYGVAVCGCAARDAVRIVAEHIPDTLDPRTELVKSFGIRAYACHPLMSRGRLLGTLSFGTRNRPAFTADELALMKTVSDHVAIAMDRKQAEDELKLAREAAEAASRAKSLFLANMSHELRTPMTGVLGMLEIARSGLLDERQREAIDMAHMSGQSLLMIINDILDLTKVESGKLVIEDNPFNLRDCVAETFDILAPEARRKGLELVRLVAQDVPQTLSGDRLRLQQVLTNLAGNAVKFTEAGKVELSVTCGNGTPDGKREILFSVSDTGIGIPEGKQELIFQSFCQADDSHSRQFGGTGLGLAISREIVELMGGTICCESKEGVGSTFIFTIPMAESVPATAESAAPAGAAATHESVLHDGQPARKRLLVAEDDEVTRKVLGFMFQKSGFDFEFAMNGNQAVEMWEKGEYDLVVMDGQMPGMDGFAATGVIRERERERGGHIPIVAMTAHALSEDKERCLAAGMDAYVSKPIDFKICMEVIRDLLHQSER